MATTSSGVVYTERVKNKRIVKQIVYGNRATILPQKNDKGHTHRWTIYIRSIDGMDDLQSYIRKVQFKLHESYTNAVRIVEKPPFELTETGWGEFDAQIKLYFIDQNEKQVTLFHYLRLYQPLVRLTNGSEMVVKEYYDEIIFNEPTKTMYNALTKHQTKPTKDLRFEQQRQHLYEKLDSENRQVIAEIDDLKRTLRDGCELVQKYKKELLEETDNEIKQLTPKKQRIEDNEVEERKSQIDLS